MVVAAATYDVFGAQDAELHHLHLARRRRRVLLGRHGGYRTKWTKEWRACCLCCCLLRARHNQRDKRAHTSKDERRCYQCALALSRARERVRGRAVSVWICGGYSRSFARSLSVCLRARLQAARQLNRANALRLCCGCCCLRAREEERQSAEAGAKYPSCPGGPADYHGNVGAELRVRYAAPASPAALPRFVGLFARRPPLLLRTERAASVCRRCLVGVALLVAVVAMRIISLY